MWQEVSVWCHRACDFLFYLKSYSVPLTIRLVSVSSSDSNSMPHFGQRYAVGMPRRAKHYSRNSLLNTPPPFLLLLSTLLAWVASKSVIVWMCVWWEGHTVCFTGSFLSVNQTRQTCFSPTHYIHPQGSNENSVHSFPQSTLSILPLLSVFISVCESPIFLFLYLLSEHCRKKNIP